METLNTTADPEVLYIGYTDSEIAERAAYVALAGLARDWRIRNARARATRLAKARIRTQMDAVAARSGIATRIYVAPRRLPARTVTLGIRLASIVLCKI